MDPAIWTQPAVHSIPSEQGCLVAAPGTSGRCAVQADRLLQESLSDSLPHHRSCRDPESQTRRRKQEQRAGCDHVLLPLMETGLASRSPFATNALAWNRLVVVV